DLEGRPDFGGGFVHRGEGDPHAKRRGHRPARHASHLGPFHEDGKSVPWNPAVLHADSNEPSIIVTCPLPLERLPPDEIAVPLHDPGTVHLERGLMSVEILTREEVSLLQPQRVPRPKADWPKAEVGSGLQEALPHLGALRRRREELESRLSGISGPGRQEGPASTGNGGPPSRRHGGALRPPPPPPPDFRWNRPRGGRPGRGGPEIDDGPRERLHLRPPPRREALQDARRPQPLQGEAQESGRAILETRVARGVIAEPRDHGRSRPRVAHEEVAVRSEARHDGVVED